MVFKTGDATPEQAAVEVKCRQRRRDGALWASKLRRYIF